MYHIDAHVGGEHTKQYRNWYVTADMVAFLPAVVQKACHVPFGNKLIGPYVQLFEIFGYTARKLLGIIYNTLKNDWVFEDFPNFVLADS